MFSAPNKTHRWVKALLFICAVPAVISAVYLVFSFVPAPWSFTGALAKPFIGPKGTIIPSGAPYESIVETIAPDIQKLSQEDRELLDRWLRAVTVTMDQVARARNQSTSDGTFTLLGSEIIGGVLGELGGALGGLIGGIGGAAMGAKMDAERAAEREKWAKSVERWLAYGIPRGMTIGKAIEEQRKFEMETQAALDAMRRAVSVKILSKKLSDRSGYTEVMIRYQNDAEKDITGFSGTIHVADQFGDKIRSFNFSENYNIGYALEAGKADTGSLNYEWEDYDLMRRFVPMEVYEEVWEPKIVVFADGSEIRLPYHDIAADPKREADLDAMRSAVTVKVFSRKERPLKLGDLAVGVKLAVDMVLTCRNNTDKDIAGFKSKLRIVNQFGGEIVTFDLVNDRVIKAGETIQLSMVRDVTKYRGGDKWVRRFVTRESFRFKEAWEPEMIVFSDGSSLSVSPQ